MKKLSGNILASLSPTPVSSPSAFNFSPAEVEVVALTPWASRLLSPSAWILAALFQGSAVGWGERSEGWTNHFHPQTQGHPNLEGEGHVGPQDSVVGLPGEFLV